MTFKNTARWIPFQWTTALSIAAIGVAQLSGQQLTDGLISHWPLDEIQGDYSPDVVSANHFELVGIDSSNLVEGQHGLAMNFDGASEYIGQYDFNENSGIPVSLHEAYTVALWVKGKGEGQADRRVFSEGSIYFGVPTSIPTSNPLFAIGTDGVGNSDRVKIFIRDDNGVIRISGHSRAEPFDGTWHHLAWVDDDGDAQIFIDGNPGSIFSYSKRPRSVNAISVGAILRSHASHLFKGAIDDVAVWNRTLSESEIQKLMRYGPVELLEIRNVELTSESQLRLTVDTPDPDQSHTIEGTQSLAQPEWIEYEPRSSDQIDSDTLALELKLQAKQARFFRVVAK